MATETKGKQNEKLAMEIGDPARRLTFLREKIEAMRDGLIRTHDSPPALVEPTSDHGHFPLHQEYGF